MAKKNTIIDKTLTYKNKPLVRCGNIIYYGNISDKFVIKLIINSYNESFGFKVADNVSVQLLSTEPNSSSRKKIIKSSEKKGLYQALDISTVWLNKAILNES